MNKPASGLGALHGAQILILEAAILLLTVVGWFGLLPVTDSSESYFYAFVALNAVSLITMIGLFWAWLAARR